MLPFQPSVPRLALDLLVFDSAILGIHRAPIGFGQPLDVIGGEGFGFEDRLEIELVAGHVPRLYRAHIDREAPRLSRSATLCQAGLKPCGGERPKARLRGI